MAFYHLHHGGVPPHKIPRCENGQYLVGVLPHTFAGQEHVLGDREQHVEGVD